MNTPQKNNTPSYLMLALTAGLWGVQPLFVKLTVQEISPVSMTLLRFILMSATIFGIMALRRESLLPPRAVLPALMGMGFWGVAINNVVQFTGLQYSTVGNATLIATATPAITAVLTVVFLREKLLPVQWIGIVLSMLSALFLICKGELGVLLSLSFNMGDVCFLFAQMGWAFYMLLSYQAMRHCSPLSATAWAGVFGALFCLIYGLATRDLHYGAVTLRTVGCMAYIIWIGGTLAMILWNSGVHMVGAATASVFLNIMPLVGVLTGVLVLDEVFHWEECFGAVGIIAGIFLLTQARQLMEHRQKRRTARSTGNRN